MEGVYLDRSAGSFVGMLLGLGWAARSGRPGMAALIDLALALGERSSAYDVRQEAGALEQDLLLRPPSRLTRFPAPGILLIAAVSIRFWISWSKGGGVARAVSQTLDDDVQATIACYRLAHILAELNRGHDIQRGFASACGFASNEPWRDGFSCSPDDWVSIPGELEPAELLGVDGESDPTMSLMRATWIVHRADTFEHAIDLVSVLCPNQWMTMVVAAQIAGSRFGYSGIPIERLEELPRKDVVMECIPRFIPTMV